MVHAICNGCRQTRAFIVGQGFSRSDGIYHYSHTNLYGNPMYLDTSQRAWGIVVVAIFTS